MSPWLTVTVTRRSWPAGGHRRGCDPLAAAAAGHVTVTRRDSCQSDTPRLAHWHTNWHTVAQTPSLRSRRARPHTGGTRAAVTYTPSRDTITSPMMMMTHTLTHTLPVALPTCW